MFYVTDVRAHMARGGTRVRAAQDPVWPSPGPGLASVGPRSERPRHQHLRP